jgi:hypothetical protein
VKLQRVTTHSPTEVHRGVFFTLGRRHERSQLWDTRGRQIITIITNNTPIYPSKARPKP